MSTKTIILDTNVLILLIVGGASESYIEKHKRLKQYSKQDLNILIELTSVSDTILVTPNILTEVSNLSRQIGEPARSEITRFFGVVVGQMVELYIPSKLAMKHESFLRLGLTDSALIAALEDAHTLITDDLDLYLTALRNGYKVENFNHLREAFL